MLRTGFKKQLGIIGQGLKDTIPSLKTLSFFSIPAIQTTLKDTVILNCIVIAATTANEFAVSPFIKLLVGEGTTYRFFVYFQYTTWTIPFSYIICGILNVLYWQKISQALPGALTLAIDTPNSNENSIDHLKSLFRNINIMVNNSFFRLLLLPGLLAQEFAFSMIPWPWLKLPTQIISGSLMNAFYAFEYDWNKAGLTLNQQLDFFQKHWLYFLGFGFPLTAIMQLIPSLYTMPAFAMLLPIFVVFSTQSTIFINQKTSSYRLPYFWFAQIIPMLTTCICKRKLKVLPEVSEPKPTHMALQTQENILRSPFDKHFSSGDLDDNTTAFKKPILYSSPRASSQPFSSLDAGKPAETPLIQRKIQNPQQHPNAWHH